MREKSFHILDEDLLLAADNELPARRVAEVRAHLSACLHCRTRMAELETTIADFVRAMHESDADIPNIEGPRSLLKAHLAQLEPTLPSHPLRRTYVPVFAYTAALLFLMVGEVWLVYQQVRKPAAANGYALLLPNPELTPGVARPVALTAVCTDANDEVVRSVPDSVQQAVFREYGISNAPADDYEVDYLITPGLGGTDDIHNLWPQPHNNTWNSYVKDELEHRLHDMVCSGQIPLSTAQQDIAANWISAYEKYFHAKRPLRGGLIATSSTPIQTPTSVGDLSFESWQQARSIARDVPAPDERASVQSASFATLLFVLLCIFGLLIGVGMERFEETIRFTAHFVADVSLSSPRPRLIRAAPSLCLEPLT